MQIINLTPHPVNIISFSNEIILTFPKSENPPRLSQQTKPAGNIGGIPITTTVFGECENMPSEQKDTYYIVSRMVMAAFPDRKDLLVPNDLVRNKKGQIVGAKSLAQS